MVPMNVLGTPTNPLTPYIYIYIYIRLQTIGVTFPSTSKSLLYCREHAGQSRFSRSPYYRQLLWTRIVTQALGVFRLQYRVSQRTSLHSSCVLSKQYDAVPLHPHRKQGISCMAHSAIRKIWRRTRDNARCYLRHSRYRNSSRGVDGIPSHIPCGDLVELLLSRQE